MTELKVIQLDKTKDLIVPMLDNINCTQNVYLSQIIKINLFCYTAVNSHINNDLKK